MQQHGQTRLHEVGGFRRRFFVEQTFGEAVKGRLNQFVYVQTVLHQHTQNTQGGAAQCVWVFVAGRNQADTPNADQGSSLSASATAVATLPFGRLSPAKRGW